MVVDELTPKEENVIRSSFRRVQRQEDMFSYDVIVVPSFQAYKTAFPGRPISESDMEELEDDSNLQSLMDEEVLSRVSSCARHERPKRVLITGCQFTVEGGELTPTLKVKRNIVNEKYAAEIAAFYEGGTQQAPQARA